MPASLARARVRALLLGALAVSIPVAVVACSEAVVTQPSPVLSNNGPSAPSASTTATATADAAVVSTDAACSLQARGISFPDAGCHDCMQTNCCALTTGCFGNAGCADLYTCINNCPSRGLPGDGGGGGTGGGDGGGDGGGGDTCVAACEAQHQPAEVQFARAFIQCYSKSCSTFCR